MFELLLHIAHFCAMYGNTGSTIYEKRRLTAEVIPLSKNSLQTMNVTRKDASAASDVDLLGHRIHFEANQGLNGLIKK